ncbi:MAG: type I methionyl aminopeptidase [Clostridia bacterium]|nr:type I methionyl aminopeptidase [Clostridia bacterium]
MTSILSNSQIDKIRKAGRIVSACHVSLRDFIRPGLRTSDIDKFVGDFIVSHGAVPAQIGYMGYPYATCTSLNDEICHAFPDETVIRDGDVLKVDFVVNLDGWLADSAWCYAVGGISKEAALLMKTTRECLYLGIRQAIAGNRIGDIGNAIQNHAESKGMSVVREYTGHGINTIMHDGLVVPHYGRPGKGTRIREGMVFTIEPMINAGAPGCTIDNDGWTARTADGSLSAQYEHTIAILPNGPEIITEQD